MKFIQPAGATWQSSPPRAAELHVSLMSYASLNNLVIEMTSHLGGVLDGEPGGAFE